MLGESVTMAEDRDKWRKYVLGVTSRQIEDGQRTEWNGTVCLSVFFYGAAYQKSQSAAFMLPEKGVHLQLSSEQSSRSS